MTLFVAIILLATSSLLLAAGLLSLSSPDERRRRNALWTCAFSAALVPTAFEFLTANATPDARTLAESLGLGLLIAAGFLTLRVVLFVGQTNRRSAKARLVAAPLAIAMLGYGSLVVFRCVNHGWWAGVPAPLLVPFAASLPDRAFGMVRGDTQWSLRDRIKPSQAGPWSSYWLRRGLLARYNHDGSQANYWLLVHFVPDCGLDNPFPRREFEAAAHALLTSADPNVVSQAAGILEQYDPIGGKISHPDIGREHGPKVFAGSFQRLATLSTNPDRHVRRAAITCLIHLRDDSPQAVPFLLDQYQRDFPDWPYTTEQALQFSLRSSVRARTCAAELVVDRAIEASAPPQLTEFWKTRSLPDLQNLLAFVVATGSDEHALLAAHLAQCSASQVPDTLSSAILRQAQVRTSHRDRYVELGFESLRLFDDAAAKQLRTLMHDTDASVRSAACRAIRSVLWKSSSHKPWGGWREPLIEWLEPLHKDASPEVRDAAAGALWALTR